MFRYCYFAQLSRKMTSDELEECGIGSSLRQSQFPYDLYGRARHGKLRLASFYVERNNRISSCCTVYCRDIDYPHYCICVAFFRLRGEIQVVMNVHKTSVAETPLLNQLKNAEATDPTLSQLVDTISSLSQCNFYMRVHDTPPKLVTVPLSSIHGHVCLVELFDMKFAVIVPSSIMHV